ncbi:MAG: alpha/beta hydrolase [Bacteroidota bacterium]
MQFIYKIVKRPFFGRFMVPWRNPLNTHQQKEWESIIFKSNSNARLTGMVAPPKTKTAKGTIVLGHPMGKEAKGFFLKNGYTDMLRDNGYNVFIFDINGFGESETGNFNYFEDIIAAGKKAKDIYPKLPLGYMGISLGGQFATISFAEEHPFEFAIVESAANTLEDFWIHYPFAYRTLRLLYTLMPKYKRQIRMIDRIKDAKGLKNLLFIYLDKDEVILDDAGSKFNEAVPIPSRLIIFKNAKHAQLPKSENREAYFDLVLNYFNSHVTPSTS